MRKRKEEKVDLVERYSHYPTHLDHYVWPRREDFIVDAVHQKLTNLYNCHLQAVQK